MNKPWNQDPNLASISWSTLIWSENHVQIHTLYDIPQVVSWLPKSQRKTLKQNTGVLNGEITSTIRWTSTKLVLGYLVVLCQHLIYFAYCTFWVVSSEITSYTPSSLKSETHHDFTKFDHEPVGVIAEKVRECHVVCTICTIVLRYGILKGCRRSGSLSVPICSYGFLWFL